MNFGQGSGLVTHFQETIVESLSLPDIKSFLLVLVMLPCMAGSVSVFEYHLCCLGTGRMFYHGTTWWPFNCFSSTVPWQKVTTWKPYRRSGEGDQLQQVSTFWKDHQYPWRAPDHKLWCTRNTWKRAAAIFVGSSSKLPQMEPRGRPRAFIRKGRNQGSCSLSWEDTEKGSHFHL